eukprot:CAMPEP_0194043604 /NCGR_PEP_ID=MMETSP0009_2-20130614/15203_1 /TAXON_ID=210454 /ORGANISM="Grammatophora oceanica, Strain CCMP 410" /LENGTH=202 /DNA_ID=CAMNT_0038687863 /DNA_START=185 /DNA_END=791 /DNA_ORIENTATION=-
MAAPMTRSPSGRPEVTNKTDDDASNVDDGDDNDDRRWKAKVCKYWLKGDCWRDSKTCAHAHGEHELGAKKASSPTTRCPEDDDNHTHKDKSIICKYWLMGDCWRDSSTCKFAHGECVVVDVQSNIKTSLCRYWVNGNAGLIPEPASMLMESMNCDEEGPQLLWNKDKGLRQGHLMGIVVDANGMGTRRQSVCEPTANSLVRR